MEKRNQDNNPPNQGKERDNIGYENTKKRSDRDDREPAQLETTDTENKEDKPKDIHFKKDAGD